MARITDSLKNLELTRDEVEKLTDALKNKEFRKMLVDYVEELQTPENQALYEQEIIQLEKQRGIDVTFVKPNAGYVIKTSADGEKKTFINVCSNDMVQKAKTNPGMQEGMKGHDWQVPHSIVPARDDVDKSGKLCKVYDFVCHSSTLELAQNNKNFKNMLNKIACESVETHFNVAIDKKNLKFPKMLYKGRPYSAVIRKPCNETEINQEDKEFMDTLFSKSGCPYKAPVDTENKNFKVSTQSKSETKYTTPKYTIKHRSHVEMEQFVEHKTAKINSAIPKELVVEITLPLIKSALDVVLDVNEKSLRIISEKPAKYKLDLNLPYEVVENLGNAKFQKDNKKLIVTLPVKRNSNLLFKDFSREDSGIESDHCSLVSSSPSDVKGEDFDWTNNSNADVQEEPESIIDVPKVKKIDEFDAKLDECEETVSKSKALGETSENNFLNSDVSYIFPDFVCHFLENVFHFTLNVKNVTESSLQKKNSPSSQSVQFKFSSVSSGFFPVYYAFCFKSQHVLIEYEKITTEVWDNNVEVQIPVKCDKEIKSYFAGIDINDLSEHFLINKIRENPSSAQEISDDTSSTESFKSALVVSTDQSEDESASEKPKKGKKKNKSKGKKVNGNSNKSENSNETEMNNIVETALSKAINMVRIYESSGDELSYSNSPRSKGILKNFSDGRRSISRSYSESSIDDMAFASSVENVHSIVSSIPEGQQVSTSPKKTVRFNDVVSQKVYRSNSSILGQRKKNQRKAKAKKRAQDRKHSESELSENEEKKDAVIKNDVTENASQSSSLTLSKSSDKDDSKMPANSDFSSDIFLMDTDF